MTKEEFEYILKHIATLRYEAELASKEINRCHKMIDRYEKMVHAEANHLDECAKNMRTYSDNIQELYEQRK